MNKDIFSKLPYRAEIDGLRAIAIVSVILYHAKMVFFGGISFEGGFIGVDIFFVISGYLITRIILFELQSKSSFSFLNFYERRARRILPMLFFVIFVSIPFAWIILLPSDLIEFAESILSSLFFSSNFYFYFSTTQYGVESSLLKPFLHTWSLGIEEQFYLIFPIIVFTIFKFFRKFFLTIIFLLVILSLQFSESMEIRNSALNFYMPFSRFWELLTGAMLAYREINFQLPKSKEKSIFVELLPIFGLYLIFYSIFFFDGRTPHPSFVTIIPIIGVSLIIGFSSKEELVGKILGSRVFVFTGLISYSAYLWHFPIFAFYRYLTLHPSSIGFVICILLTLVLSATSYKFIEQPFRKKPVLLKTPVLKILLFSFMVIFTISFLMANEFIKNKPKNNIVKLLDNDGHRREMLKFELGFDYSIKDNGKKNILIIGNSQAEDLLATLSYSHFNERFNLNLISSAKKYQNSEFHLNCLNKILKGDTTWCDGKDLGDHPQKQYNTADLIFIAPKWFRKELRALPDIIDKLISDGKTIIIVSNTPESSVFGEKRFNRFDAFIYENKILPDAKELSFLESKFFEDYQNYQSEVNKELQEIVNNKGGNKNKVFFADRSDYMCNKKEKKCYLYFQNTKSKVLWDYGHITISGAKNLANNIDDIGWLKEIF